MNEELKFKLQAHLDEELSESDTREIADLLAQDHEGQALLNELRFVKGALPENELEMKLPESREFFWSKIQRQIEREQSQPESKAPASWWKPVFGRYIGGFAAATALLMLSFVAFHNHAYVPGELEGNGEMSAITYHSNSDQMTVVYLFDRERDKVVDSE